MNNFRFKIGTEYDYNIDILELNLFYNYIENL